MRLIDNPSSILTTTGFYACRIVGTIVGAWVLVRVSDVKYLSWNMAGALALCAALLFVRNEAAIYAAVGLLGFYLYQPLEAARLQHLHQGWHWDAGAAVCSGLCAVPGVLPD